MNSMRNPLLCTHYDSGDVERVRLRVHYELRPRAQRGGQLAIILQSHAAGCAAKRHGIQRHS